MMIIPVPVLDAASPAAFDRMSRAIAWFADVRRHGADFMPVLVPLDRNVPPVMMHFTDDSLRRAFTVATAAAHVARRHDPVEALLMADSFVRVADEGEYIDIETAPAPSDDAKSVEALMLTYVARPKTALTTYLPYGRDDRGRVSFKKSQMGWKELPSLMSVAAHLAVAAPDDMPDPPSPAELVEMGIFIDAFTDPDMN